MTFPATAHAKISYHSSGPALTIASAIYLHLPLCATSAANTPPTRLTPRATHERHDSIKTTDWITVPLHPLDNLREKVRALHARLDAKRGVTLFGRPRPASLDPNPANTAPTRSPGPLSNLANAWWSRLIDAVYGGGFSAQQAEYESGETRRDYLWNTIGTGAWGMVFPVLTIVATQLAGTDQAGRFSMAFAAGTLLMFLSNYGVRTFQVSDIEEANSFASYQLNRWITSVIALVVGLLYCTVRGYGPEMLMLSMGVYVCKIVDGLADVYEGRLQQADKLYLAGISQALRSIAAMAAFSVLLLLTRSTAIAAVGMAIAAVATLALVSIPLALLETEASRRWDIQEVGGLFRHCFPLFSALFLFNLIESIPKFAMEGMLAYDNQLYFNALFFPAQGILLAAGFLYKPQLLRLANIWSNPRRRKRFDLIVLAMAGVIALLTAGTLFFMAWLGIPIMSFMYGVDFEKFRTAAYLMIIAGGVSAAIDFVYAVITVLRHQSSATKPYLITFAFALVVPAALIFIMGLNGAVIGYLASMSLLMVLLAIAYYRIRQDLSQRNRSPFHA